MFEKSLVDLIRGMRHHAGNEKEYMQKCLKECNAEIQSQDLDIKATALLKVIYLEMFGLDMSWAAFRVLEVMSSAKYHQKRVGYLGAVQSFRPDTEVLMLATNLIKKDLASSATPILTLPIAALPHIANSSLALSCLGDLVPRLTHNSPAIRKKTIVTLYRLALVYPETLRAAWPRIKERLMDEKEDPCVTAAIVNVVCELGWRRPRDFLPLAPRLFQLLVDAHNNWMAIKLIKLFASLTHVEPRLIKKLLPPLTDLIRTTTAMSLLYECINGIIQGGILGSAGEVTGREEIASLCVSKLRGMIMVDGDPNLKYVALLAFNRIVTTHPLLVAEQEDVILECIDSKDITIRVKALDLVQGMVSSSNLIQIVSRLMRQLKGSTLSGPQPQPASADEYSSSDGRPNTRSRKPKRDPDVMLLPTDYRVNVMHRIVNMCSQNNYADLVDFEWYVDVLTQLIRSAPPACGSAGLTNETSPFGVKTIPIDIAKRIGDELRSIAVKVVAVRPSAVSAAETIIARINADSSMSHPITIGVLKPVFWVLGEYADELSSAEAILNLMLQLLPRVTPPDILATGLQSVMKIMAALVRGQSIAWTSSRKTQIALMLARVIHVFEPLTRHPDLEVQERSVQFVELLKLTAEAVAGQPPSTDEVEHDTPLLLTQAIPSLFAGAELRSVAVGTQRNVPIPDDLDLDEPINPRLGSLLATADQLHLDVEEADDMDDYYHKRPAPTSLSSQPAINRLADVSEDTSTTSYQQQATEESYLDNDILARRRAERLERNRDDPFYIGSSSGGGGTSSSIHNILKTSNGPDLDIDAIPIMQLDLGSLPSHSHHILSSQSPLRKPSARRAGNKQRIVVAADETFAGSVPRRQDASPHHAAGNTSSSNSAVLAATAAGVRRPARGGLLLVDSSHIASLASLDDDDNNNNNNNNDSNHHDNRQGSNGNVASSVAGVGTLGGTDAEMAAAMKEVERLRLEMQRASERVHAADGVEMVSVVRRTKKRQKKPVVATPEGVDDEDVERESGLAIEEKTTTKKKTKKKSVSKSKTRHKDAGGEGGDENKAREGEPGDDSIRRKKPSIRKKSTLAVGTQDQQQPQQPQQADEPPVSSPQLTEAVAVTVPAGKKTTTTTLRKKKAARLADIQ